MNLWSLCTLFTYILISDCVKIVRKVFPIKYDLTITPHFETELESSFEARLVFTFKALHHGTDQTIELHADNLDVESFVLLANVGNATRKLETTVSNDKVQQLITVDAGYPLSIDETYQLHVNYSGRVFDDGWGLYKGSYEHKGNQRLVKIGITLIYATKQLYRFRKCLSCELQLLKTLSKVFNNLFQNVNNNTI